MPIKLKRSLLVLTYFILTGCNVSVENESTATAAPLMVTATLAPTSTVRPSETLPPPPPQPTTAPVEGTTSTQLNVRAEPSTASEVIGIIAANSKVQIIGKDIGESWWQIAYEAGLDGKGWVTAQYVETG
ncbi:MAG TPA: SH3 domain-containing protein, partial [Anaerolineales bacterium]|nr:SH3 domain-containing protein [Anaerolineales bacterium]